MDFRQSIRKMVRGGDGGIVRNSLVGAIYPPPYSANVALSGETPSVFNARGERMDFYFLRDRQMAHDPYCVQTPPAHWLWDRYNYGLSTHFYSHWEMLKTMGSPDRRYGMLLESRAIVPDDYGIFSANRGLEQDFDLVFTYDDRILDSVGNARFAPFCATPWFGTLGGGGTPDENAFMKKNRLVSICSSNKRMCPLHGFRLDLALQCKRERLADTFGTFDGGAAVRIAETLEGYRYSIAVENDLSAYFFTERITNCFLSMTVPIYCGAERIGDFFNEDGIIRIRPGDDIRQVLRQCSPRDYEMRLPAIRDNFGRVQQFRNMWDWLYDRYLKR